MILSELVTTAVKEIKKNYAHKVAEDLDNDRNKDIVFLNNSAEICNNDNSSDN